MSEGISRMNRRNGHHVAAFTLLEVLASIFVIIIMIGLLIVGLNKAISVAKQTADRQSLVTISTAITVFKNEYGFTPPLIRDRADVTFEVPNVVRRVNGRNVLSVFMPSDLGDREFLRGGTAAGAEPDDVDPNPYNDPRYSEFSLGFYLCGACEEPLLPQVPGSTFTVDGVPGLGFLPPNGDGTFDVPADYYTNPSNPRRLLKQKSDSLLDVSGKNLRLEQMIEEPNDRMRFPPSRLVDARGVPFRYYKWIPGRTSPTNPAKLLIEDVFDYNIPPLVGFTTDAELNPDLKVRAENSLEDAVPLRSATWAIVGAGLNGVFGDEEITLIAGVLGSPMPTTFRAERQLRNKAADDNVMEVGE